MKTLKTMDKQEYLVSDDECEYLSKTVMEGRVNFITLSNGDVINVKSISRLGSLDTIKSWGGYILRADGRSFNREGDIVYLDGRDVVEEIEDPKYKTMNTISIKKLT